MRSVAVNTEPHERFEKHQVGLINRTDFNKFGVKLVFFLSLTFMVLSIPQGRCQQNAKEHLDSGGAD